MRLLVFKIPTQRLFQRLVVSISPTKPFNIIQSYILRIFQFLKIYLVLIFDRHNHVFNIGEVSFFKMRKNSI